MKRPISALIVALSTTAIVVAGSLLLIWFLKGGPPQRDALSVSPPPEVPVPPSMPADVYPQPQPPVAGKSIGSGNDGGVIPRDGGGVLGGTGGGMVGGIGAPIAVGGSTHPKRGRSKHQKVLTDQDLLERSLSLLPKGNLAYSTPQKMRTGETAHIMARVGADKVSLQVLQDGMSRDEGESTSVLETLVSTKMKMTLTTADFRVTPLSSEEQFVSSDSPTTWEWEITPKRSGKLRLHLAAVVELNKVHKDYTTVDRDISVEVDTKDASIKFVERNWKWITTTLLLPLIGAVWGVIWHKKKRKKEEENDEDEEGDGDDD
jgi:hypothetical protein